MVVKSLKLRKPHYLHSIFDSLLILFLLILKKRIMSKDAVTNVDRKRFEKQELQIDTNKYLLRVAVVAFLQKNSSGRWFENLVGVLIVVEVHQICWPMLWRHSLLGRSVPLMIIRQTQLPGYHSLRLAWRISRTRFHQRFLVGPRDNCCSGRGHWGLYIPIKKYPYCTVAPWGFCGWPPMSGRLRPAPSASEECLPAIPSQITRSTLDFSSRVSPGLWYLCSRNLFKERRC